MRDGFYRAPQASANPSRVEIVGAQNRGLKPPATRGEPLCGSRPGIVAQWRRSWLAGVRQGNRAAVQGRASWRDGVNRGWRECGRGNRAAVHGWDGGFDGTWRQAASSGLRRMARTTAGMASRARAVARAAAWGRLRSEKRRWPILLPIISASMPPTISGTT